MHIFSGYATINLGDGLMGNKALAVKYIKEKLEKKSFLSYEEIAQITDYHPKYILKLKKDIIEGKFHLEHGNKNKVPVNKISPEEEEKIVTLYKRSNASIRKFCNFYHTRSYSCIYGILKKHGLLEKEKK